jgi:hypothetical protein
MKTSVKSALVRHSGALAVALLAFSFSLGSSDAVRAQDPEVSTPSLSELVFAPFMKAVEGIEQRLANLESTLGLFASSFNSEHIVTKKLCIADEAGEQTCITKAQLDAVLTIMTHAEATPASPAVVEAAAAPTVTEAAAEPAVAGSAETTVAEAVTEEPAANAAETPAAPAESATIEETAPATPPVEAVEAGTDQQDTEPTGSLPNSGAATIWYPEVETSIP